MKTNGTIMKLMLTLLLLSPPAALHAVEVRGLRCEYRTDPLGIDVVKPRLSWVIQAKTEGGTLKPERGVRQTAYQVLVASSPELLAQDKGDLWDSGKITSDETIQIAYAGKRPVSSQEVFWKVRAYDQSGKPSAWSATASWTMGVLDEKDWSAKWIGADADSPAAAKPKFETVLVRREFVVKPGLRRALVHVCGLGQYELSINGQKAGGDFLSPGWSKYDKTCLYDTRDITALLKEGKNAAGLFLGNGMYNVHGGRYTKFTGTFGPPKAIAQVRLEYADGATEIIGTDERWRIAAGPITFSSIYGGEDFDARLEQRGWDRPGFVDSKWSDATIVNGPGGTLRGQSCAAPPLRVFETLKPVSTREIKTGVTVDDLGQNAAVSLRLRAHGPAGSFVKITPAELIHADGSVNRGSAGGGDAHWLYTLRGDGSEEYESHFWYHGSRYFQVERGGAKLGDDLPVVELVEAPVVQSASEPAGGFSCSFDLFNRIHTLVRWAQRANMVSVLTDCPHRERLGWLEQYHLNGPSLRYEWDLTQLFTKGVNDMADSQLANGLVPDIAPEYVVFNGGFRDSPEWGSAFVLVPWQQYEFCGDIELLRRHYDGMKRYVEYLGGKSKDHIVSHGLGDWYDIGPKSPGYAQLTPIPLTATAFYFQDATILAQTAALLGKTDDARQFESLAADIRAAFNAQFFEKEKHRYATGAQCANAIPLVMNLAESENRAAVVNAIIDDIRSHGNGLTAGDVGYRYLLRALADAGRSDVIFEMNSQTNKPGYGIQLARGATSLTEAWDANPSSSQNHFMLGQINEWFYHDLAGIQCDPTGPGFKKIIIKPAIVGDLTWVTAHYDSIHGRISSKWQREGNKLTMDMTIPANTQATVYVPAKDTASVTESGKPAGKVEEVKFLRRENNNDIYALDSGAYQFHSALPENVK
jgi:hypothetical protein